MEISKNFDFKAAENKWYTHWLDQKYFESTPDQREPYTVVIPPPNVTGILHNDTPFNVLKKTCMDYYTTPWENQHPNGFDAEILGIIYTNSGSGQKNAPALSTAAKNQITQMLQSQQIPSGCCA